MFNRVYSHVLKLDELEFRESVRGQELSDLVWAGPRPQRCRSCPAVCCSVCAPPPLCPGHTGYAAASGCTVGSGSGHSCSWEGSKFIGEEVNEEEEQHFNNQKSMRWMNGVMRKKNNDRRMTENKTFCFTPDSTSIFCIYFLLAIYNVFFLEDIKKSRVPNVSSPVTREKNDQLDNKSE